MTDTDKPQPTPTASAPKAEPAEAAYKDPATAASVAQQAPPVPTEALTANTTEFSYPPPTEAPDSTTPTSTSSSTSKPPQVLHAPTPTEPLPIGQFTGPTPSNPYSITGANVEATATADGTSKPHKTHGIIQKAVGSVQIGVGKLVHNSNLVEKGQEKKIRSGEERQAKREHNIGGGDHGKTGLRRSMEGDDMAPTGRYY